VSPGFAPRVCNIHCFLCVPCVLCFAADATGLLHLNREFTFSAGSVVIHLFLPEIREKYELEKLWSLGPEHDGQYQEMLADDRYAEMVRNAKLEDFFVNEETSK
jgi:hypothetical protein